MRGMSQGRHPVGASPAVPLVRPRGVLRFLTAAPRAATCGEVEPSHRSIVRAGRGLAVFLHRRRRGISVPQTSVPTELWPDLPLDPRPDTSPPPHLCDQEVRTTPAAL